MSINYSTLATLVDNSIKVVAVQFKEHTKEYYYKTTLSSLKKDDFVVVQCAGESSCFGFAVAKVSNVDCDLDYDAECKYKWVVQQLNTEGLNELLASEEEVISKIKDLQKSARRKEIRDALGISSSMLLSLSSEAKAKMIGTML